jgi:hypothetical protein
MRDQTCAHHLAHDHVLSLQADVRECGSGANCS